MPNRIQNTGTPSLLQKEFPILSICREDLQTLGYNTDNVDDETMERLAHILAEDSFEQMFSESLETAAESLDIPKRGENQEG